MNEGNVIKALLGTKFYILQTNVGYLALDWLKLVRSSWRKTLHGQLEQNVRVAGQEFWHFAR